MKDILQKGARENILSEKQIYDLYESLSLEERVGELLQLSGDYYGADGEITGQAPGWVFTADDIYHCGSILNTYFAYYLSFFDDFLAYVKQNGCPLDFFSWHNYGNARNIRQCAEYARHRLDEEGFSSTESICNEWNCEPSTRGTLYHAVKNTANLLAMQKTSVDSAMFYDARIGLSEYGGLFHPMTRQPYPLYYGFAAFGELRKRETEVACRITDGIKAVSALAAKGENDIAVLIVNESGNPVSFDILCEGKQATSCRIITEGMIWKNTALPKTLPGESILLVTLG